MQLFCAARKSITVCRGSQTGKGRWWSSRHSVRRTRTWSHVRRPVQSCSTSVGCRPTGLPFTFNNSIRNITLHLSCFFHAVFHTVGLSDSTHITTATNIYVYMFSIKVSSLLDLNNKHHGHNLRGTTMRVPVPRLFGLRGIVPPLFRMKGWRICCHLLLTETICRD